MWFNNIDQQTRRKKFMVTMRTDVMQVGGKPATVFGDDVKVGQKAPEFVSAAQDWSPINPVAESKGKVAILSAVPSLDTTVCDRETRRFNQEAANLDDEILIWTISTDFPMAQKRWCGAAGIDKVKVVSDVLEADFGLKYGLLIKERRFLRRAVFVVNRNGELVYVDYMKVLGDEPNYAEVIEAARKALE
jgi:thioredoxin-dependent peroxiredoxin